MAYCRFGADSDVYMYNHVQGFIECCACRLSPMHTSIFTGGLKKDDPRTKLFGDVEPCKECKGEGCDACMIPGHYEFNTYSDAIAHLEEHRKAGHNVSQWAIDRLIAEMEKNGDKIE